MRLLPPLVPSLPAALLALAPSAAAQAFPGTGEGLALQSGVDGAAPDGTDQKTAPVGGALELRLESSNLALEGAPALLGIAALPLGQVPASVVPGIALDLSAPVLSLSLGVIGGGGSASIQLTIPGSAAGTSLFLQGFAVPVTDPSAALNGLFASTDAHQVDVFVPRLTESRKLVSTDLAANDGFGQSVSLDGDRALVGAPREDASGFDAGSAYLFDVTTGNELQKIFLPASQSTDNFGSSLALLGDRAWIGAWRYSDQATLAGAVYGVNAPAGVQVAKLTPVETVQASLVGQSLGFSTALSETFAVSGARGDVAFASGGGSAYIYDAADLSLLHKVFPSDPSFAANFGHEVATAGDFVAVAAPFDSTGTTEAGSVYLFDGQTGQELHKLEVMGPQPFDLLGDSLAMDEELLLASSRFINLDFQNEGAAYAFEVATGALVAELRSPEPSEGGGFGASVAISNDYIAVGEILGVNTAGFRGGLVHLFDRATLTQVAILEASDGLDGDSLGLEISISGTRLLAGAEGSDGVGENSGAAYVFELP